MPAWRLEAWTPGREASDLRFAAVERAYRQSTRALGLLLFLLGVAMVAVTVARGGGPLALGVVIGVPLTAVGAARLVLAAPRRGGRART